MKKCLSVLVCTLFFLSAFAQTTTITYAGASLGTACNIFNPQRTINGVVHHSYGGGVTYSTAEGLGLATTPQSGPPGGTSFYLDYLFVPGYKYKISITAKGDNALFLKTSVIPNFTQFSLFTTNSCTPDSYTYGFSTAGLGQYSAPTSSSSAVYNVPEFTVTTGGYQYLMVWASGGLSNLALDVLGISKIEIVKTTTSTPPVTPTFTLPATTALTCGSSSPITFTVANVNSTTGIINYTWNLGSFTNGWLFNGSPANQFISTGTSNTIQLTPACGTTQVNISAVVAIGSNFYYTNASVNTYSLPTMSITGNTIIGTLENYSVAALPCNATVSWSASPAGIVNLTNQNTPTATATRITDGNVTLTAVINACGGSQTITKSVITCAIPATPTNLSAIGSWQNPSYYGYTILFTPIATPTSYYLMDFFDITTNTMEGTDFTVFQGAFFYYFLNGHTYKFRLAAVSSCGKIGAYTDWSNPLTPPVPSFTLPATTNVICGDVSPKVFTVANVLNAPGITSYNWDLGSASNGWTYNGSPAPQTFSTSSNTISLTPACNSILQNVKASAMINSVAYATNTSAIAVTPAVLSISGNGTITNSEVYNISGAPCNASAVWSATPSGLVNLSCTNCLQPTVTTLGPSSITLSAAVTACGSVQTITRSITTLAPPSPCSLDPLTFNAFRTHPGGSYHDGYETCTFTAIPGVIGYQIESQAFNISTGQSVSVMTTNSTSNTVVVYTGGSLPNTGWSFHFRVRANCTVGGWGSFSGWSATFAL